MPRGITPRKPAKSGRHEGLRAMPKLHDRAPVHPKKSSPPTLQPKVPIRSAPASKAGASARGYKPTSPERISEILKRLDQLYPDVTCALTHSDVWELLVSTILSAQSTDVRVNMVTPELFKKYPTVQEFARLDPQQLEPDIRSTGFFRNKSKSVVGAAKKIVSQFGGQVPENMHDLLTLPGVARKTANVVLGTGFEVADGVVVDTHVHRISRRLELTKNDEPKKIEEDLMLIIP